MLLLTQRCPQVHAMHKPVHMRCEMFPRSVVRPSLLLHWYVLCACCAPTLSLSGALGPGLLLPPTSGNSQVRPRLSTCTAAHMSVPGCDPGAIELTSTAYPCGSNDPFSIAETQFVSRITCGLAQRLASSTPTQLASECVFFGLRKLLVDLRPHEEPLLRHPAALSPKPMQRAPSGTPVNDHIVPLSLLLKGLGDPPLLRVLLALVSHLLLTLGSVVDRGVFIRHLHCCWRSSSHSELVLPCLHHFLSLVLWDCPLLMQPGLELFHDGAFIKHLISRLAPQH